MITWEQAHNIAADVADNQVINRTRSGSIIPGSSEHQKWLEVYDLTMTEINNQIRAQLCGPQPS